MEQNNNNTKNRSWQQINEKTRYKIEAYLEEGMKASQIAKLLNYSVRTIQREIKLGLVKQRVKNTNYKKYEEEYIEIEIYRADVAQRKHDENASRKGRNLKIGNDYELVDYIEEKIKNEHYSPDAVIGRIKFEGKKFKCEICTKTLYSYIDKGIFLNISNGDLYMKNNKKRSYKKVRTVALNNKTGKSISERSEEIDDRSEKGHWEIDLFVGKKGTKPAILTLVERKTRKSVYILIKDKTQKEVLLAIKKIRKKLGGDFDDVIKTITADNGPEFLDSEGIKKAADCSEVYYAHPYCSWERGSNENSNRMLRRFIPKGTNIGTVTESRLQQIEDFVNNYPRKILGYRTANEAYYDINTPPLTAVQ